jgi:hypothetical protein
MRRPVALDVAGRRLGAAVTCLIVVPGAGR